LLIVRVILALLFVSVCVFAFAVNVCVGKCVLLFVWRCFSAVAFELGYN